MQRGHGGSWSEVEDEGDTEKSIFTRVKTIDFNTNSSNVLINHFFIVLLYRNSYFNVDTFNLFSMHCKKYLLTTFSIHQTSEVNI